MDGLENDPFLNGPFLLGKEGRGGEITEPKTPNGLACNDNLR